MYENYSIWMGPWESEAQSWEAWVSFNEAETVFYDEQAIQFYDDDHSEWEDRFLMLGLSSKLKLLLVCHCFRENESVIRIISARKATKTEAYHYGGE